MLVNSVAYAQGRKLADVPIAEIPTFLDRPDTFLWVGLADPDLAELAALKEALGLHELAVEDMGRGAQRPKIEEYGNRVFLVLQTMEIEGERLLAGETHIYAGERFLLSVRRRSSAGYAAVRARCEEEPELLRHGPGFVAYALMDFIVDHYFPIVAALEDDLNEAEERMFHKAAMRHTPQLFYRVKRRLMRARRALFPLLELDSRLQGSRNPLLNEATRPYFRDVFDHVARLCETLDGMHEMLTTAMQVNLSLITAAEGDVTKRLAAWAALFAIPTMVGGIYGMNFKHMPELEWTYGYPMALGGIVAVCSYLFYRFKKAGWI
ncbi:Cobalt/magnesium transport protein CorA [Burkholderiales bacterium]|nr:MAG: magnesium and cobalt transport protein CorA [Burkholderiales bacterium]CAG0993574.1 Cobalt/magnesium transport protein CorA [Burkholderiales bacterium]